jgi:CBS domain-containing protein
MLGGDVGGNVEAVKDAYGAWMSEGRARVPGVALGPGELAEQLLGPIGHLLLDLSRTGFTVSSSEPKRGWGVVSDHDLLRAAEGGIDGVSAGEVATGDLPSASTSRSTAPAS